MQYNLINRDTDRTDFSYETISEFVEAFNNRLFLPVSHKLIVSKSERHSSHRDAKLLTPKQRNRVNDAITTQGYLKSFIAKQLGVSVQTLSKILNGKRKVSPDELKRITELLNVKIKY